MNCETLCNLTEYKLSGFSEWSLAIPALKCMSRFHPPRLQVYRSYLHTLLNTFGNMKGDLNVPSVECLGFL